MEGESFLHNQVLSTPWKNIWYFAWSFSIFFNIFQIRRMVGVAVGIALGRADLGLVDRFLGLLRQMLCCVVSVVLCCVWQASSLAETDAVLCCVCFCRTLITFLRLLSGSEWDPVCSPCSAEGLYLAKVCTYYLEWLWFRGSRSHILSTLFYYCIHQLRLTTPQKLLKTPQSASLRCSTWRRLSGWELKISRTTLTLMRRRMTLGMKDLRRQEKNIITNKCWASVFYSFHLWWCIQIGYTWRTRC